MNQLGFRTEKEQEAKEGEAVRRDRGNERRDKKVERSPSEKMVSGRRALGRRSQGIGKRSGKIGVSVRIQLRGRGTFLKEGGEASRSGKTKEGKGGVGYIGGASRGRTILKSEGRNEPCYLAEAKNNLVGGMRIGGITKVTTFGPGRVSCNGNLLENLNRGKGYFEVGLGKGQERGGRDFRGAKSLLTGIGLKGGGEEMATGAG